VGLYHGANLQQQWGNKMAVYFEAVACADIAGHHFVTGTRFDPHGKLIHGLPVVIPHPNPLPWEKKVQRCFVVHVQISFPTHLSKLGLGINDRCSSAS
jgi:hypothetical protein